MPVGDGRSPACVPAFAAVSGADACRIDQVGHSPPRGFEVITGEYGYSYPLGVGVSSSDGVRLVDAAQCEVYVCYDGPLGSHLKAEVREKIWKRNYVEIFSLLEV